MNAITLLWLSLFQFVSCTKKYTYLLAVSFTILLSCNKNISSNSSTSPWFDSLIKNAENIYDNGSKEASFQLVKNARATGNLNPMDQLNYYSFCDFYYRRSLGDYCQCISIADSMLQICNEYKGNRFVEIKRISAYNNKADALLALGDYKSATEYYYMAKKAAQDFSDSCALGNYSYSLSMVMYMQERYHDAAQNFLETYREVSKCNPEFSNFYRKQELLNNIGLCYYHLGIYDSGIYYYNKALEFIHDNKNNYPSKNRKSFESAEAVILGNLADIYYKNGEKDTAIELLRKSILVNLQKDYVNTDAEIDQIKLAKYYFEAKDFSSLTLILKDIQAELDSIPNKNVELDWNKLMWQYYENCKQPEKAYQFVVNYTKLNDSIEKQSKLLAESDMEGRIKNREKQYQLILISKDEAKEKIYLLSVSITAIFAVLIIVVILFHAKRTRENLEVMTGLNNKIGEQRDKLEKVLTDLEQKDKDKTRILRSVAHDVMNPIAAIMAITDLLADESDQYSDEQKELLGLIKQSCQNSLSLSKDILEASQMMDSKEINKELTNITELVKTSVELLGFKAAGKKQKILFNCPKETITASVNKEKIWRVINNIIGNAIKFSYDNSIIEVTLEIIPGNISTDSNNVRISVKDSGIGIPEKNKPHLFDMFTEAKNIGTAGETSNGLGLSILLQIIKAHGGNITFESEKDKGTIFYIIFPAN